MKIIECCESLFCMFGYPVELVSDNGSQFVSDETEEYLKMNNLLHRKVSPYWPSANGEVERFIMTLGKTINSLEAEGKNWRVWLNAFLLDYRTSIHRAIGKTPADVLMRYKVKNNIPDYNENDKIEEHEEIQKRDSKYKEKIKIYTDEKRNTKIVDIEEGDEVLLLNKKRSKNKTIYENKVYKIVKIYKRSVKIVDDEGRTYIRNKAHIKKYRRSKIYLKNNRNNNKW